MKKQQNEKPRVSSISVSEQTLKQTIGGLSSSAPAETPIKLLGREGSAM